MSLHRPGATRKPWSPLAFPAACCFAAYLLCFWVHSGALGAGATFVLSVWLGAWLKLDAKSWGDGPG